MEGAGAWPVMTGWVLPPEFDPSAYRLQDPSFASLDDTQLVDHYRLEGRRQGLPSNGLRNRRDFAALVPPTATALEIGPFAWPVLRGPNVCYCDVLDTAALRRRAGEVGADPAQVPPIHYVMGPRLLDDIPDRFDVVLSSHAIEHQPNLVSHLLQVEGRLGPQGRYFLLVPDKRFCFDHDIAPSTIADVLQAHEERRTVHALKSVIEHRALTVHNDAGAHWRRHEDVLDGRAVNGEKVRAALEEYRASAGRYVDVHAWYFTPDSFRHLVRVLGEIGILQLKVERLYRTRRNANEFWAVLGRQPSLPGPWDELAREDAGEGVDAQATGPVAHRPAARGLLGRMLRTVVGKR